MRGEELERELGRLGLASMPAILARAKAVRNGLSPVSSLGTVSGSIPIVGAKAQAHAKVQARNQAKTQDQTQAQDQTQTQEQGGGYQYLTSMPIQSLTAERLTSLQQQAADSADRLQAILASTEASLWLADLDRLSEALLKAGYRAGPRVQEKGLGLGLGLGLGQGLGQEQGQGQQQLKRPKRIRGVTLNKAKGKYRAEVRVDGKPKHFGIFGTPEEAVKAVRLAKSAPEGVEAYVAARTDKRKATKGKDKVEVTAQKKKKVAAKSSKPKADEDIKANKVNKVKEPKAKAKA